jgi:hypothetical protein
MALVLARFLYGFCLSWMVAAVLIAATLLCIRLVGIAVVAFDEERKGDIAGAVCVAVVIVAALAAMVGLARWLYDALGASYLAGGAAHWLAGGNTLSPAAIFGALAGCGSMAGLRGWINRPPRDPAQAKGGAKAAKEGKARANEAAPARKSRAAAAPPARKAAKPPRGARIPQLGWIALFLLLLGCAVFAFAYGVEPLSLPPDATAAAARLYRDMAARARPVYLAAAGLFGTGVLFAIAWYFWRRKPDN